MEERSRVIREQGCETDKLKEVNEFPCKRRFCKEGIEVKVKRLRWLPESEAPVRFTVVISPESEQVIPCQKQGEDESDQFERKLVGSEMMFECLKLFNNVAESKVVIVEDVKVSVMNETIT